MAKNIGYYNDPVDIKELADKTPAQIVRHHLKKLGCFFNAGDPDYAPIRGLRPVTVSGKKWYVKKTIDRKHIEDGDNFIDIFLEPPAKPRLPRIRRVLQWERSTDNGKLEITDGDVTKVCRLQKSVEDGITYIYITFRRKRYEIKIKRDQFKPTFTLKPW